MPSYQGELRLTNKHVIAATHQGADSNAALPRHRCGSIRGEAWRGDDVASALARGHGLVGSGGGGIGDGVDADLLRKCCSVGSCGSRRAPGCWSGFVLQRPRRRRRAWLGLSSEAKRPVFQSGALRGTTGLRRAARACSLAQVCRGTPTQSGALPVALLQV